MFISKTLAAFKGRRIYLDIKKSLAFSNSDFILFFPEKADDDFSAIESCIPKFMENKQVDGLYCIWTDEAKARPWIKGSVTLSGQESKLLLDFYDLYNFNKNLIIASLRLPWGRRTYLLENFKGLTKEDLYYSQFFK